MESFWAKSYDLHKIENPENLVNTEILLEEVFNPWICLDGPGSGRESLSAPAGAFEDST